MGNWELVLWDMSPPSPQVYWLLRESLLSFYLSLSIGFLSHKLLNLSLMTLWVVHHCGKSCQVLFSNKGKWLDEILPSPHNTWHNNTHLSALLLVPGFLFFFLTLFSNWLEGEGGKGGGSLTFLFSCGCGRGHEKETRPGGSVSNSTRRKGEREDRSSHSRHSPIPISPDLANMYQLNRWFLKALMVARKLHLATRSTIISIST